MSCFGAGGTHPTRAPAKRRCCGRVGQGVLASVQAARRGMQRAARTGVVRDRICPPLKRVALCANPSSRGLAALLLTAGGARGLGGDGQRPS